MKKILFFTMVLFSGVLNTFADDYNGQTEMEEVNICLTADYVDGSGTGKPIGRSLLPIPVINIDGNLLTVPELLLGSEMNIVVNGEIVASEYITSVDVLLPTELPNTYIIKFYSGNYCFWSEIQQL